MTVLSPDALSLRTVPGEESLFLRFLRERAHLRTYLEPMQGNNGDGLILLSSKYLLNKLGVPVVATPAEAQQIFINGGGAMNDVGGFGIGILERHRTRFPHTPCFIGPSTYRFRGIDFAPVMRIGEAPLDFFARDFESGENVTELNPPANVRVQYSQDIAFELQGSEFIEQIKAKVSQKHVLIAMRKDREGTASPLIQKAKCKWLPRKIRRPLSAIRDRLAARGAKGQLEKILAGEDFPKDLPRIYRDVSVSVPFDEYVAKVRDAAVVITDRLHVAILAHLLDKRLVMLPGSYHKIRGVYQMSMNYPGSKTTLWEG